MKSISLALCFVAVVVLADPVQDRWNKVHQECQQSQSTYVPDIIFEQLKKGQNPVLPANFGLHANCMLVKLDLQDAQGKIVPEGVRQATQRQYSDAGKVNQIVADCSANKETKEEAALSLFKCLGQNRVNIGQF